MSASQKELQELLVSKIEGLFAKGFCITETHLERSVDSIELKANEPPWVVSEPGNQVEITIKLGRSKPDK